MNLETLDVKIKVDNKQAVRGLNEAKKASERVTSAVNKVKSAFSSRTSDQSSKELTKNYRDAQKALDSLLKKQEALRRHRMASPQYKRLSSDIAKAEKEIDRLIATQEQWASMGDTVINSAGFQELDQQIENARASLERMYAKRREMAETGSSNAEAREWHLLGEEIDRARAKVRGLEAAMKGGTRNGAVVALQHLINGFKKAGHGIKSFASGAVKGLRDVVSWIGKMGRGFGKVLSKIPLLGNLTKQVKGIKRGLFTGLGLRGMLRMGAYGFLIYKGLSMAKEGFKNLAQYSGQTNKDLSMLASSLATLKNALATAFAPILTAIAPALNYLIQLLVKAATAVAHFTAAFTGKSTVVVAKQQTVDYASSLNDAADAAGSANDAAEKYQKTLLGFDQMNILNSEKSNSGSGGSGSGGSGTNVGDMFETVEVTNGAKTLAEKIKEAWAAADFTDLGMEAGTAIKNALESIPWDSIKEKAEKAGKSVATFLNGLNDSGVWSSVAKTVGEGINTLTSLFSGFIDNFNFTGAGSTFADAINTFFGTVDWKKIGTNISNGLKGVLDFFTEFCSKTNWEQIGRDLVSVITSIDWAGLIVKGIKAAGSIAVGLLNLLKGAFEEAVSAVVEWISSGDAWQDIKNIGKAALEFTVNVGGAILDTISSALSGIWEIVKAIGQKLGLTSKNDGSYGLHDGGTTGGSSQVNAGGFSVSNVVLPDGVTMQGGRAYINTTAVLDKTDQSKLTSTQKQVKGMSAILKTKTEKFSHTTGSMTSYLKYKTEKFSHTSNGMTAKLSTKSEGFSHTSNSMTAKLSDKSEKFSHTTEGMTANITNVKITGRAKAIVASAFGLAGGGLYRNGRWMPVTAAAGGGSFNTGQMFVAREAGPELVGKIGSGTTVMNNDQIVASVSAGVYKAVVEAMSGSDDRTVNVYLQGDAGRLFKVVQKEAVQYINTTGLSPFPA